MKNTQLSEVFFLQNVIKKAICKPRQWNLIIGNGIGIGTDITNAIISSSTRPMDSKLCKVVTKDDRTPTTKPCDTLHVIMWQTKNFISPHSQDPWPSKLGKALTHDEGARPIFPQPQGLWPPNLTGYWLF